MEHLKQEDPDDSNEFEVRPIGPYHAYEANTLEPCAITTDEHSLPVHLLTCGHLVAIDNPNGPADNRCGLNCLHITNWVKQQTINAPPENIDLHTGKSLGEALTSTVPLQITKDPILPKVNNYQSHHTIFCEVCYGVPASSYFIMFPEAEFKRALALTRPVIEHFTSYTNEQILNRLCKPFHSLNQLGYDWKFTHLLSCGHEVWAQPARPCASNCSDSPQCKSKIFPENQKQGDAIFCHECVYRAEKVYERYTQVGKGIVHKAVTKNGLADVPVPEEPRDVQQLHAGSTYGVATPGFGDYQEYMAADGYPYDPILEREDSFTSSGAET